MKISLYEMPKEDSGSLSIELRVAVLIYCRRFRIFRFPNDLSNPGEELKVNKMHRANYFHFKKQQSVTLRW